jgi:hypothetical protein
MLERRRRRLYQGFDRLEHCLREPVTSGPSGPSVEEFPLRCGEERSDHGVRVADAAIEPTRPAARNRRPLHARTSSEYDLDLVRVRELLGGVEKKRTPRLSRSRRHPLRRSTQPSSNVLWAGAFYVIR